MFTPPCPQNLREVPTSTVSLDKVPGTGVVILLRGASRSRPFWTHSMVNLSVQRQMHLHDLGLTSSGGVHKLSRSTKRDCRYVLVRAVVRCPDRITSAGDGAGMSRPPVSSAAERARGRCSARMNGDAHLPPARRSPVSVGPAP